MSRFAEVPVHKITINIGKEDYEFYKDRYGSGWQQILRQHIREKVRELKDGDK